MSSENKEEKKADSADVEENVKKIGFDNELKYQFADCFAPVVHVSPNERYRFMNPEVYVNEMCYVKKEKDAKDSHSITIRKTCQSIKCK